MHHHRVFLLVLALSSSALASPTAPNLAIDEASVISLGETRQLRIRGDFHYDDLVQVGYPFQVMVYTAGGHYVRYDLSGRTYTGAHPAVGDGIDAEEAALLLGHASISVDGGVVSMAPNVLDLRLPAALPWAPLTVQIFVEDQGRIIFSNTRAVVRESLR